jgi:hypothetical protein
MGGLQTFRCYPVTVNSRRLGWRTLKAAAALATVTLLLLSAGAFVIGGAMGASVLAQPRWAIAVIVVPGIAVAATIIGTVRERFSLTQATASYLAALTMLPFWFLLTR